MKNTITINVRTFPVLVHDHRTGVEETIIVPVTKEQLQASQIVGQSSKELIERLCNRQGFTVLEISKPGKHTLTVDLERLIQHDEKHRKEDRPEGDCVEPRDDGGEPD